MSFWVSYDFLDNVYEDLDPRRRTENKKVEDRRKGPEPHHEVSDGRVRRDDRGG